MEKINLITKEAGLNCNPIIIGNESFACGCGHAIILGSSSNTGGSSIIIGKSSLSLTSPPSLGTILIGHHSNSLGDAIVLGHCIANCNPNGIIIATSPSVNCGVDEYVPSPSEANSDSIYISAGSPTTEQNIIYLADGKLTLVSGLYKKVIELDE